jgi:1,4-alpha-glucan branching enzyme
MLNKRRFKEQNVVRVTFVVPPHVEGNTVHLLGDFNEWQRSLPMRRQKNGSWRITVALEPGREYQFRYLVDGQMWLNDPQADRYVANPYGEENSVVVTQLLV